MPTQRGRYYLSRVIKLGSLTQDKLAQAIRGAPVLHIGKFQWAITDAVDGRESNPKFIFGKLAKYSAEGHVTIVDPALKSQLDALAPNLLMASSPFVEWHSGRFISKTLLLTDRSGLPKLFRRLRG